ncbi:MAG: hypothetical protein K0R29_1460 [Pseudobdellovibrio sp.]|nr:hypothetical protein [Pseudobdellovibrio sp.]
MLFHQKKWPEALELINEIIGKTENQKSLELKALIQKSSGSNHEAIKTYKYITQQVSEAGLKPVEAVGAYFDLGVLEYQAKNYDSSQKYFTFCISVNFNSGASYFFRALINYQNEKYAFAMNDFQSVLRSSAVPLKAISALYLSEIYSKQQNFEEAIFYLGEAKNYSDEADEGVIALTEDLQKNRSETRNKINENVQTLNTPQYFRNVALILTADSNVLSVPASGSVADLFSGKASNKVTFKGLFGHAEGYFEDLQEVWAYQLTGNLNENRETETGQFITNDLNYLWNIKPYSASSQSYRVNVNSNFQYQVNPSSGKGAFGPYSLAVGAGYSRKLRNSERSTFTSDYFLRYENFLQDPAFSDFMKKSGFEAGVHFIKNWDSKKFYFNPALGVGLKGRYSTGNEYRNLAAQITAANQFYFSPKNQATVSLSYSYISFNERLGTKRLDFHSTAQWEQTIQMSESLSALLSASYTLNESNITDIYKYDRTLYSAGFSYSF